MAHREAEKAEENYHGVADGIEERQRGAFLGDKRYSQISQKALIKPSDNPLRADGAPAIGLPPSTPCLCVIFHPNYKRTRQTPSLQIHEYPLFHFIQCARQTIGPSCAATAVQPALLPTFQTAHAPHLGLTLPEIPQCDVNSTCLSLIPFGEVPQ